MWTLIITIMGHAGVSCIPVYGFVSKEAAEAAKQPHSNSTGGQVPIYYSIVNMGDTA